MDRNISCFSVDFLIIFVSFYLIFQATDFVVNIQKKIRIFSSFLVGKPWISNLAASAALVRK